MIEVKSLESAPLTKDQEIAKLKDSEAWVSYCAEYHEAEFNDELEAKDREIALLKDTIECIFSIHTRVTRNLRGEIAKLKDSIEKIYQKQRQDDEDEIAYYIEMDSLGLYVDG